MGSLEDIRENRLRKLELLKEKGINPYPIKVNQDFQLKEIIDNFSKLSKRKKAIFLVGRIMSLRPQGGLIFFNFSDGTALFQGLIKKTELDKQSIDLFDETVDVGDFLELKGILFKTKRGEKTILTQDWRMISKSLRPLPEKWHGLQDTEERFRKRYLDILMSEEVKERFIIRSRIISEVRNILDKAGYIEVDTPVLQSIYGGANAKPFITHHNVLDIDLYLRISDELYLKRIITGGMPKVYEIARDFRNEGIDHTHNPEFTMLEFYESYSDSKKQMAFVEKMIKSLVKKIHKKNIINYGNDSINFLKKFEIITYYDLFKKYTLINYPETISEDDLSITAKRLGVEINKSDSKQKILDEIFKKVCKPKLIQPTFIIDYPADLLPLAKKYEDNLNIVDAFQLYIGGIELVKAFSELNDPIDQKERLLNQEKNKNAGDKEAQPYDKDFIEAMEYGMPPAGGVGIGIDRLTMLMTNTQNIKEVILFPTMRSRE